jgi:hypothetical protein
MVKIFSLGATASEEEEGRKKEEDREVYCQVRGAVTGTQSAP